MGDFCEYFLKATGAHPYRYQARLALSFDIPHLLRVETGLGKTAAVTLAWLWRRHEAGEIVRQTTPRRLIYCLPQRSLVSQTAEAMNGWLENLGYLQDAETLTSGQVAHVRLAVLMGGELDQGWDGVPECDQIIVGTQDQLLSRALNRGYAMSRYRWPIHYAWLNNDVLWVMDECQLMGNGLATTAQLQAFRQQYGTFGPTHSLWMSATLDKQWLATVDYKECLTEARQFELSEEELAEPMVARRVQAAKRIMRAGWVIESSTAKDLSKYAQQVAKDVRREHRVGTLTLVIVNRVARAQAVARALRATIPEGSGTPELILVHSRYRPAERAEVNLRMAAVREGHSDAIIVATQAVEAGVDISARTLITEMAPWSSLVQRFGRCNRRGEANEQSADAEARILVIDVDTGDDHEELCLPYTSEQLNHARYLLNTVQDGAPGRLPQVQEPPTWGSVVRRRDVLDWFDTTGDLSGYDVDVSPYIRETLESEVAVLWRQPLESRSPSDEALADEELCRVSISQFRELLREARKTLQVVCWKWNSLDGSWVIVGADERLRPGEVYCLDEEAGGYDSFFGFLPSSRSRVDSREQRHGVVQDATARDIGSELGRFVSLDEHTRHVLHEVNGLLTRLHVATNLTGRPMGVPLSADWRKALIEAALWHDVGKAHAAFQSRLPPGDPEGPVGVLWAKAPRLGLRSAQDRPTGKVDAPALDDEGEVSDDRMTTLASKARSTADPGVDQQDVEVAVYSRRYFRHELASAIAYLEHHARGPDASVAKRQIDLIAYLIASHHGKVRMSIRSLPGESSPRENHSSARGVIDGDRLPRVTFPGLLSLDGETVLHLDWMNMGVGQGGEGWLSRTLGLLGEFGPFGLSWLESLLRIADWRGSQRDMEAAHDNV